MEANFTVESTKSVSCLNTSQKVTPTGLSHNNMVSSPEISAYMTVITKTDGQGAKKRHHIDSGLNATRSYGAERSCARLCGSWESHWWPFAVQSQTHLQNYAFPIDFMLKWLRKKKKKKSLCLNLNTVPADKFLPLSTQGFPPCSYLPFTSLAAHFRSTLSGVTWVAVKTTTEVCRQN